MTQVPLFRDSDPTWDDFAKGGVVQNRRMVECTGCRGMTQETCRLNCNMNDGRCFGMMLEWDEGQGTCLTCASLKASERRCTDERVPWPYWNIEQPDRIICEFWRSE